jgi:Tfp pilus assembly major pilin PilA
MLGMHRQRGVTLIGLIIVSAVVALFAIIGFKLLPSYIEYYTIKRVIADLANGTEVRGGSVRDVQSAFDRRAQIDNISSIRGSDLEVVKQGAGSFEVAAAYTVQVPLFGNLNACIDFSAEAGR